MDILVGTLAASAPLLLAVLGAAGWLYRHERELKEAAESQVSEHKYKAYIELLDIFFDMFKASKKGTNINQNRLVDRTFDANKELTLYASDDVLRIHQNWMGEARSGIMDLGRFGDLIVAIRKDMGHPETTITSDDVLRQLISDYDQAKAEGKLRQVQPSSVKNN